jgi:hypothetical protein
MQTEYIYFLINDSKATQYNVIKHTTYTPQGSSEIIYKTKNKQWHNIYGPANEITVVHGPYILKYCNFGLLHRVNGPAHVWFSPDGVMLEKEFFTHGKMNCHHGPASVYYYDDGTPRIVRYYINDKLHCDDGPAHISYNPSGTVDGFAFYIHGRRQFRNQVPIPVQLY